MNGIVAILGVADATNEWLADAWRDLGLTAVVVRPEDAERLGGDDVLIGRLDILPTLDGIEHGIAALRRARGRGVRIVNDAASLLCAHDKRLTAALLSRAGLPHPPTEIVHAGEQPSLAPPVVVKPRYGSWGREVERCETKGELEAHLASLPAKPWFRRHGAVVQRLLPGAGYDLRIVVAGGRVVGATERVPAAREWRTNMSLGGSLRRAHPSSEACELARGAAAAAGTGLVGVDLMPVGDGWVVLELNGTVDFDRRYSLPRSDVYAEAADALGLTPALARVRRRAAAVAAALSPVPGFEP